MTDITTSEGHVSATLMTRFTEEGLAEPVPRELVVDMRGPASTVDLALAQFSATARIFGVILAFSANASVGLLEAHLAFDNTSDRRERDFLEVFIPDESGLPREGRAVDVQSTVALLDRYANHPDAEQLSKAIGQYALALDNWFLGGESLALAHTYMSAEALEKAVVSKQSRAEGVTAETLAFGLGLSTRALGARVRRETIFQGDIATYDAAKSASDGLEHGSMPLNQVHESARSVALISFKYVRAAILDVLDVPDEVRLALLSDRHAGPLDSRSLRKVVRGVLLVPEGVDDVAAHGQLYPLLEWRSSLKTLERDETGLHASFSENVTLKVAEGVQFQPQRFEVHGRVAEGQVPVEMQAELEVNGDAGSSI